MAGALAVVMAGASPTGAQNTAESDIKAAFLFNFAKFIEWPSDVMASDGRLAMCVVGNPPVADALARAVKSHNINGHDVVVSTMPLDGAFRACHLLFVSGVDAGVSRQLVQTLAGTSVFTVSDFERFARLGGVTNFYVEDGHLRFAINVDAAGRARLHVSSKLLALATIVKDE